MIMERLEEKTTFSKGVPTFVQDYFSGKVLREGGFLNGKQNGLWKEYSFVGNDYKETYLKKSYEFKNGVLHGVVNEFNEKGSVVGVQNYTNGVIFSNIRIGVMGN